MTLALEKAAQEEKEKKEAKEKQDAEKKDRDDNMPDALEEEPETVGFLKHRKVKTQQKERDEAKKLRE